MSSIIAKAGKTAAQDLTFLCIGAAAVLLIGQLAVGTDVYFAGVIFISNVVVIMTVRNLGLGSVGGILVTLLAFRYLFFAQIAKTLLGQPGNLYLTQPSETVTAVFLGTLSVCAAALLVKQILGRRPVITINPSIEGLAFLRNVSLIIGIALTVATRLPGGVDIDQRDYGGINGISNQFDAIILLAPYAETWRALAISKGKRSTTPLLYALLAGLVLLGFLHNSKGGMAIPIFVYLIASVTYRARITKPQIAMLAAVVFGGLLFAYPAIQMLRNQSREANGELSLNQASNFVSNVVEDPSNFFANWSEYKSGAVYGTSKLTDASFYLGTYDELAVRFTMISIVDLFVDVVDEDGAYGWDIVTYGLKLVVPTFLYPDKPRDSEGDLVTWHYGLRTWGVVGYLSTGLLTDAYIVAKWPGIIFIPFVVTFLYFFEIQLAGTGLARNFIGSYFVIKHYGFGEENLVACIVTIVRHNPIELAFLVGMFYLSDMLTARHAKQRLGGVRSALFRPAGSGPGAAPRIHGPAE